MSQRAPPIAPGAQADPAFQTLTG